MAFTRPLRPKRQAALDAVVTEVDGYQFMHGIHKTVSAIFRWASLLVYRTSDIVVAEVEMA